MNSLKNNGIAEETIQFAKLNKKQKRTFKDDLKFSKIFKAKNDFKPSFNLTIDHFMRSRHDKFFRIHDLKHLMLYVVSECVKPKWIKIHNKNNIKTIVFILANNLSQNLVRKNTKLFSKTAKIFNRVLPMNLNNILSKNLYLESAYKCFPSYHKAQLLLPPLPDYIQFNKSVKIDKFLINDYQFELHKFPSISEIENGYTTLNKRKNFNDENVNFVSLDSFQKIETKEKEKYHIVGIDCEMVLTEKNSELARCTVVDFNGQTIYDEFCRPKNKIVDFCTQFSGIDEKIMSNTTKSLKDVQNDLKKILFEDTILVGHSLENDLHALQIHHRRLIDTSVLYSHSHGEKWKIALRFLAQNHLNRAIQKGEKGHDSAEDAVAALDLLKLKFERGFAFGNLEKQFESIFSFFERNGMSPTVVASPFAVSLLSKETPKINKIESENTEKSAELAAEEIEKNKKGFFFVCLENNSEEKNEEKNEEKSENDFEKSAENNEEKNKKISTKIDDDIDKIFKNCPLDTLFIVASGDLMTSKMKRLAKKRKDAKKSDSKKIFSEEEDYQKEFKAVSKGIMMVAIK